MNVLSASRRVRQSRISSSAQQRLAPEAQLALHIGAGRSARDRPACRPAFEQLLDRLVRALRGLLRKPGRQAEHLEQRAQDGDVDLLRRLDVLELLEFVKGRSASSVILPESILSPVIASTMSPE